MKDTPVIANEERRFSAHHLLVDAAKKALDVATPVLPLVQHGASLTAITLSSLALEALLNAIGDLMVKYWDEFKKLQPRVKLRLVAQVLNVEIDLGKQPWQDFVWLFSFRNEIAEAKPEVVRKIRRMTLEQFNDEQEGKAFYKPESTMEAQLTLDNGWRALNAYQAIYETLVMAVPIDKRRDISNDACSGAYKIAP